jgi:hypothetical protein
VHDLELGVAFDFGSRSDGSAETRWQFLPYRDPNHLDRLMDGLRNAGIAV